jgi:hypothetical protein
MARKKKEKFEEEPDISDTSDDDEPNPRKGKKDGKDDQTPLSGMDLFKLAIIIILLCMLTDSTGFIRAMTTFAPGLAVDGVPNFMGSLVQGSMVGAFGALAAYLISAGTI